MADNTAQARKAIHGHRAAVREHIAKYKKYPDKNDKDFALKTISRVQAQIAKLRSAHPSIPSASEDTWRP
jgi:hypothetical protein